MQFQFFKIPASDSAGFAEELNAFLRAHRILNVHRELVTEPGSAYWAICVEYLQTAVTGASPNGTGKAKIDYREKLNAEDFTVFSALRDIRKELAERDGVPVYAVFTSLMDGPVSGSNRLLRGGNWNNDSSNCRVAYRNNNNPNNSNNNIGFRSVRSSEDSPQRENDSDPAAIPPALPRASWQSENTLPVLVGVVDAMPKTPGGPLPWHHHKTMNAKFDCVEMKNRIQAKMLEEEQRLGAGEMRRRRQEWLAQGADPLARWWRTLTDSSPIVLTSATVREDTPPCGTPDKVGTP